ncbi:MAG: hypothetical protein AAGG51_16540 [Cyanobacteria bacterium P01_G01_bin.54]
MNPFIQATANKAICSFVVSRTEYQTLSRLLDDPQINEQDAILARRVLYGVRHGLVSLV